MSEEPGRQELERELAQVRREAAILSEEVAGLQSRLDETPQRVRKLEERLLETKAQLSQSVGDLQLGFTNNPTGVRSAISGSANRGRFFGSGKNVLR